MRHPWPGRFSRATERDEAVRAARDAAVAAFLDMDSRQSVASSGVSAVTALHPERNLRARWESVEAQCFAAAGAYLDATNRFEEETSEGAHAAFSAVYDQLVTASQAVDQFYVAHRATLDDAIGAVGAVPRIAEQARSQAHAALATITDDPVHRYRSVSSAADQLRADLQDLASAEAGRDAVRTRDVAARVREHAGALTTALTEAPAKATAATRALASVRTRLQAVGTRAEGIGPAYSALLREFVAASSTDLTAARTDVADHMARAEAYITAAARDRDTDPESALEAIHAAREHLAAAEARIADVTGRLDRLRRTRDDPGAAESAVRFALRDAQLLAVTRGLVREWGSVLDAQADRIVRAHAALDTHRPDYWAFLREIDSITEFIAGVVSRMRGRHDA